jgi:hypothetical protein
MINTHTSPRPFPILRESKRPKIATLIPALNFIQAGSASITIFGRGSGAGRAGLGQRLAVVVADGVGKAKHEKALAFIKLLAVGCIEAEGHIKQPYSLETTFLGQLRPTASLATRPAVPGTENIPIRKNLCGSDFL